MIQAKNVPSPLVPTGTETLVIPRSLSFEGLPAVVALCCGPRAMNLTFVVDQAKPVGGCESTIGMVADQPDRCSNNICLVLFLPLIFLFVFLLLKLFIDGVDRHLNYATSVLGKLLPVPFNATPHQILLDQVIPATLLTTY